MSAENRTGVQMRAPAPANAYAAPFRESREWGGAAREVVHWVLLCACTADCSHGAPLPTRCWRLCILPCILSPYPGQGRVRLPWFRPGQGLHCSQDVLSLLPAGNCPLILSPGLLGEEGMGDLGRKLGRSNDTSRFFFKPLMYLDKSA